MKRILITGGAGFVGSSIALALKARYENTKVVVLDNLLRRGSELNLTRLSSQGVTFIHGDVRQPTDLDNVGNIDFLIECSAEPSVLAGADGNPGYVVQTNLQGAINCAEFCRKQNAGLLFLSTSRGYSIDSLISANTEETTTRFTFSDEQKCPGISANGINEDFPTAGFKSFYGASKFAAEVILEEYRQLFDWPLIINRCGLIAGPWQFGKADQGIIPFWVKAHMRGDSLRYIGFNGLGKQMRDAIHIDDLVELILLQLEKPEIFNEGVYNVGGGKKASFSLQELTQICRDVTGQHMDIGSEAKQRYADIPVYYTDNTKIENVCNWKSQRKVEDIVTDVHSWLQKERSLLQF
ncbi:MAG: NAD-dependent epimerase/dehydratase family protein [Lentisphaeraceae bacterium]|nr:NAD-dependent epimerase/dehydratase family protein [Lentisphaeraceae bacterium]